MEDILNKTYKRKGAINSDTFIVENIENDFVIFTNGARCKITTLQTDFEELLSTTENLEPELNADTFFDTPFVDNTVLDQLETVITNPNTIIKQSDNFKNSKSLDIDNDNNSFNNRLNESKHESQQVFNNNEEIVKNRLPEWDVFDRVKKSEEIEILVPFKIKLPRPEKLDALNDMFETSFSMYLAKQYIKDYVINNSIQLQKTIQDSIEEWMETELYGNKKKKAKPKAKPKAKQVEEEIVIKEEIVTETSSNEGSALSFFNNEQAWNGDIKKLLMINTEEQYNAVKNRLEHLIAENSTSMDIERYEDMIFIYEQQLKDQK